VETLLLGRRKAVFRVSSSANSVLIFKDMDEGRCIQRRTELVIRLLCTVLIRQPSELRTDEGRELGGHLHDIDTSSCLFPDMALYSFTWQRSKISFRDFHPGA